MSSPSKTVLFTTAAPAVAPSATRSSWPPAPTALSGVLPDVRLVDYHIIACKPRCKLQRTEDDSLLGAPAGCESCSRVSAERCFLTLRGSLPLRTGSEERPLQEVLPESSAAPGAAASDVDVNGGEVNRCMKSSCLSNCRTMLARLFSLSHQHDWM